VLKGREIYNLAPIADRLFSQRPHHARQMNLPAFKYHARVFFNFFWGVDYALDILRPQNESHPERLNPDSTL
jgi:hypothetical protein